MSVQCFSACRRLARSKVAGVDRNSGRGLTRRSTQPDRLMKPAATTSGEGDLRAQQRHRVGQKRVDVDAGGPASSRPVRLLRAGPGPAWLRQQ